MLALLLYGVIFVTAFFPESSTGRAISRIVTDLHTRVFRHLTWARVGFAVLLICAVIIVIEVTGPDGIRMMAAAAPEAVAWFVTFDIATYLDVLALAWVLSTLVRVRAIMAALRSGWKKTQRFVLRQFARARLRRRQRTNRARRPLSQRKGREEEPGWPGWIGASWAPVRPSTAFA